MSMQQVPGLSHLPLPVQPRQALSQVSQAYLQVLSMDQRIPTRGRRSKTDSWTEPKLRKRHRHSFCKKHSDFLSYTWQLIFRIDHRSHCVLITFVENTIIKINDIDVTSRRVPLSLGPCGLKWLEVVAQHKSLRRDPVHGRLHFHVPHKVTANGQDRVKQRSAKTLPNDAIFSLTSSPVLALLIHKEQHLVQHHLY